MNKNKRKITFLTLKEMAELYGLHPDTLRNELKKLKKLNVKPYQRYYTPKQITVIYQELGNPTLSENE